MKSMTTKMMLAAAALVVATGVASAEQYRADIPFAFHAGGKTLAAGTYELRVTAANQWMVVITNRDTLKSSLALPISTNDGRDHQPAGGAPTLTFVCGSSRCSLTQVWSGSGYPSLNFPQPRISKDERASTVVRTVKMNAD